MPRRDGSDRNDVRLNFFDCNAPGTSGYSAAISWDKIAWTPPRILSEQTLLGYGIEDRHGQDGERVPVRSEHKHGARTCARDLARLARYSLARETW